MPYSLETISDTCCLLMKKKETKHSQILDFFLLNIELQVRDLGEV